MGYRVTPESFEAFVKSMKAVTDRIRKISSDDVDDIGQLSAGYIQEIFPKSTNRSTQFQPGSHRATNRGQPLYTGWRTYPTSLNGAVGFLLKHARQGQDRVATVLASLDQGSKAHQIQLQNAQAFRFLDLKRNVTALRSGSKGEYKTMNIPARAPQPGPEGYIKPTIRFIQEMMDFAAKNAANDMEQSFAKSQLQYNRIKASAIAGQIRRIASKS